MKDTSVRLLSVGGLLVAITLGVLISQGTFASQGPLSWPLSGKEDRPEKLTFGLYVTPDPAQNPIDPPERFIGFHTALDLEVFEDEMEKDVPVSAACDGKVLVAGMAEGYGGLIIHSCTVNDQPVTILYGHLDSKSFTIKVGDMVTRGQLLGILGDHKTPETDGNRKHLHFSVHKGTEPITAGYVQEKSELDAWIDPVSLL